MIPANATIIRKAYDDFGNGNVPAVLEAFDASITWHVPGHSPLSGDYKGHDEVVGFFKHTLALCGEYLRHRGSSCPCRRRRGGSAGDRERGTQRSLCGVPGGACMAACE